MNNFLKGGKEGKEKKKELSQQDKNKVKTLAIKPDDMCSIPGTHTVEGEN